MQYRCGSAPSPDASHVIGSLWMSNSRAEGRRNPLPAAKQGLQLHNASVLAGTDPFHHRLFSQADRQATTSGKPIVEVAQRFNRYVATWLSRNSVRGEVAIADAQYFQAAGQVGRRLCRPGAVASDLRAGGRLGQ